MIDSEKNLNCEDTDVLLKMEPKRSFAFRRIRRRMLFRRQHEQQEEKDALSQSCSAIDDRRRHSQKDDDLSSSTSAIDRMRGLYVGNDGEVESTITQPRGHRITGLEDDHDHDIYSDSSKSNHAETTNDQKKRKFSFKKSFKRKSNSKTLSTALADEKTTKLLEQEQPSQQQEQPFPLKSCLKKKRTSQENTILYTDKGDDFDTSRHLSVTLVGLLEHQERRASLDGLPIMPQEILDLGEEDEDDDVDDEEDYQDETSSDSFGKSSSRTCKAMKDVQSRTLLSSPDSSRTTTTTTATTALITSEEEEDLSSDSFHHSKNANLIPSQPLLEDEALSSSSERSGRSSPRVQELKERKRMAEASFRTSYSMDESSSNSSNDVSISASSSQQQQQQQQQDDDDDNIMKRNNIPKTIQPQSSPHIAPSTSCTQATPPTTPTSTTTMVTFTKIEIREYERVVGDNPSVSSGVPLSIGWKYSPLKSIHVDEYEQNRQYERRMVTSDLLVSPTKREYMLRDDWNESMFSIRQATKDAAKARTKLSQSQHKYFRQMASKQKWRRLQRFVSSSGSSSSKSTTTTTTTEQ
eukprot:CAMPEP_0195306748 /NCGR_PEP_ID=MMETSP0707-20130614/37355_1 /TAXON_ID=33640 /ORGANISM="Asterionellopsis glacialis, Strain CCMP134" /LENGTH=578 /DNA_ID=CAMNT_0040370975 /DNA_START=457 /DNA_END=2193 /DNA_ORIENTATION=+